MNDEDKKKAAKRATDEAIAQTVGEFRHAFETDDPNGPTISPDMLDAILGRASNLAADRIKAIRDKKEEDDVC